MDPERWQRLSPLLDALFELPAAARAQRLRQMRADDPELTAELESLIALEEESGDFLAEPLLPSRLGARAGHEVGPYRLERLLGEGGMGQVWLAMRSDGLYQRRVALKLLRPGLTDTNLRLRFTRERQILARLAHPHIARLLDAGVTADGLPYLALEYVDGEPITDYCRTLSIPLSQRLRMFHQVCDAVSHAHANLIVHRDLKPSNILVTPAGDVRLLDFGIAKLLDSDVPVRERTRTGTRAFTLHYAAPEQIRGEPVTTMTDVYSLGVVLYELLTDRKPYPLKRDSDAAWEEAILATDPVRPSQGLMRTGEADTGGPAEPDRGALRRRARMLSGDLDNIVLKALSKRPEQRYPSVEALSLDLRRFEEGRPVMARPQGVGYRMRKYVSRHRWELVTAAAVLAVVATSVALVGWQARQALREAARAQAIQEFMVGLFEEAGGGARPPTVLRDLLAAAEARDRRHPEQEPRTRAEMLGLLAHLRMGLGDYPEAESLLARQAAIVDRLPGLPPSLRLESLTLRGELLAHRGEHRRCIELMDPGLPLAQGEQAQLPVQSSGFYTQLGRCRRGAGERRGARQMFERALDVHRRMPVNPTGSAGSLADLAGLRADAGDRKAALEGLDAATRALHERAGPRHPMAVDLQLARCALHREGGDLPAAERACGEALALAVQLHGPGHRATFEASGQLAGVHLAAGRHRQALDEFLRNRDRLRARLGPHHPEVLRHEVRIGAAQRAVGDASARGTVDRAIAAARATGNDDLLADARMLQAQLLLDGGQPAEAEAALREARRILPARRGRPDPRVGAIDRTLGEIAAKGVGQKDTKNGPGAP